MKRLLLSLPIGFLAVHAYFLLAITAQEGGVFQPIERDAAPPVVRSLAASFVGLYWTFPNTWWLIYLLASVLVWLALTLLDAGRKNVAR